MINKTAYMTDVMTMHFKEIPMPEPKPNEVILKIDAVGICGSDVHFYKDGRIGDNIVNTEFTLGHETAGIVYQLGSDVKNLKVGDRVAVEPGYACGKCEFCKKGLYNLCPEMHFFADHPIPGCLMNYLAYPADWCFKLPDNMTTEEGALVEPLSVGLHACKQGGVTLGDNVVIIGSGCIGLVTLLSAKAFGASKVVVIDLFEKRLEFAKKMGASEVINAGKEDVFARVNEIFEGRGADVVLECCGSAKTVYETVDFCRPGGTVVLVGMPTVPDLTFHVFTIMMKELTVKSVFRYRNLYPTAINAISSGTINVKQIVTHRFSFEDTKLGFDTAVNDPQNMVKGVIKF